MHRKPLLLEAMKIVGRVFVAMPQKNFQRRVEAGGGQRNRLKDPRKCKYGTFVREMILLSAVHVQRRFASIDKA